MTSCRLEDAGARAFGRPGDGLNFSEMRQRGGLQATWFPADSRRPLEAQVECGRSSPLKKQGKGSDRNDVRFETDANVQGKLLLAHV